MVVTSTVHIIKEVLAFLPALLQTKTVSTSLSQRDII